MKSRCSGWPKDHGSNSYSLRIAIWDSFCAYGISSLVVRPLVSCLLYLTNPLLPCSILVPVPMHCVSCVCVHCGYCVRVSCSRASLFRCLRSCLVPVSMCWSRFRVSRLPSRRVLSMRRSTAPSLGSVHHVSY